MKKNLVEVNFENTLSENNIIVFRNNKWVAVDKAVFLNNVNIKINNLNSKIDKENLERIDAINLIEEEIKEIKRIINYILGEDTEQPEEQNNEEEQDA